MYTWGSICHVSTNILHLSISWRLIQRRIVALQCPGFSFLSILYIFIIQVAVYIFHLGLIMIYLHNGVEHFY